MQNRHRLRTTTGLRLRKPATADLESLVGIEAACFASPWPTASLAAELCHENALLVLAELPAGAPPANVDGGGDPAGGANPVGYAAYRAAAGEAELLRLAVVPAARRRGIATALLAAGDDALAAAGVEICYLEVRAGNRAARAFYETAGFHAIGVRPRYYSDGDDAHLLARSVERGGTGAPDPG